MDELVCVACMRQAVQDEFQVLFECRAYQIAYQQIRINMGGSSVVLRFGVNMQSAIRILAR